VDIISKWVFIRITTMKGNEYHDHFLSGGSFAKILSATSAIVLIAIESCAGSLYSATHAVKRFVSD
jgi:hypothetical protein